MKMCEHRLIKENRLKNDFLDALRKKTENCFNLMLEQENIFIWNQQKKIEIENCVLLK